MVETEYLSYLPSLAPNDDLSSFSAKELDIHYCQMGDLWLSVFIWRMLCCARDAGLGNAGIDSLDLDLLDLPVATKTCLWRGRDLLAISSGTPTLSGLPELWSITACPGNTWREELNALLSDELNSGIKRSWRRVSALNFGRRIGLQSFNAAQQFPSVLLSGARTLVASLASSSGSMSTAQTVDDHIIEIERRARFPILPFFLWNVIEKIPVTYLVAPVWTSQQYPVQVRNADCQHIGLALCAVDPLHELEFEDASNLPHPECFGEKEQSVGMLVSFLRVISRPLVEGSLYASAVTAARNQHRILRDMSSRTDVHFGGASELPS
jgi:hypothetical protein